MSVEVLGEARRRRASCVHTLWGVRLARKLPLGVRLCHTFPLLPCHGPNCSREDPTCHSVSIPCRAFPSGATLLGTGSQPQAQVNLWTLPRDSRTDAALCPRTQHTDWRPPCPLRQSSGGGNNHAFAQKRWENPRIRKNIRLMQGQNPALDHLSFTWALTQAGRAGSEGERALSPPSPPPEASSLDLGCGYRQGRGALGFWSQPSGKRPVVPPTRLPLPFTVGRGTWGPWTG